MTPLSSPGILSFSCSSVGAAFAGDRGSSEDDDDDDINEELNINRKLNSRKLTGKLTENLKRKLKEKLKIEIMNQKSEGLEIEKCIHDWKLKSAFKNQDLD